MDLSTILIVIAGCVLVTLLSIRVMALEKRLDAALRRLDTQNARSVTLAKMAHVEASLTELTDAYDALLASHKKLRSRIGMRAVREGKKAAQDATPDPAVDPAGYKRVMRLRLNSNKL